jgi:AcrR family transcriptional regulator
VLLREIRGRSRCGVRTKQSGKVLIVRSTTQVKTETPKRVRTREAIWTAALDLFARQGFERTKVEAIAAAAGVARRTFFRQFESKNDLMSYAVTRYGSLMISTIEECPKNCPLPQVFRYVVSHVAQAMVSDLRMRQVMAVAATERSAREAQLSGIPDLQDRIAAAFAARGIKPVTAGITAELTVSALSMTYRIWYGSQRQSIAAIVEQVMTTLSQVLCQ